MLSDVPVDAISSASVRAGPPGSPHALTLDESRARAHLADLQTLQKAGRLFVVGCPKSGTTWLQRLLNEHPAIVVRGEGSFAWSLGPVLERAIGAFNRSQRQAGKGGAGLIDAEETALQVLMALETRLAPYVRSDGRAPEDLAWVGDKTPQHAVGMRWLDALFPGCRFLHILRDPRDAMVSAWFHWGRGSGKCFEAFGRHFLTQVWPAHVGGVRRDAATIGPERVIETRYEALLDDPQGEAARLFDALGVAADEATTARCVDRTRFERLTGGREAGEEAPGAFLRKGVVGDWQSHVSPATARAWTRPIAHLMRSFGYDPGEVAEAS